MGARFGEEEVLEGASFEAPDEAACDDLCRMTVGLFLLTPVAAKTTGFLFPDRWLFSPDRRPPDERETVEALGVDTATSSLKRVVVDLRAEVPATGIRDSIGVEPSSKMTASSLLAAFLELNSLDFGIKTEEPMKDELEPELEFFSIGGGRVVIVRLFSFGWVVAFADARRGLWGVGVIETSSDPSSSSLRGLGWGEAGEPTRAVLVGVFDRVPASYSPKLFEERGDGFGVVLM